MNAECFDEILDTHWYGQDLAQRDYQIKFANGRSFAEVQILKKINWSYLLKRVEYFDEIWNTHWYQVLGRLHLNVID